MVERGCFLLPACLFLFLILVLVGCRAPDNPVPYAREYPLWDPAATLERGDTLDIQVFRLTKHLELTNTTPRAFGPSTIWLNGWYSRPVESLGVGQSLRIPLSEFRDMYSDAFRGGGFFAADDPDVLVTAELETTGEGGELALYRLIVIDGEPG